MLAFEFPLSESAPFAWMLFFVLYAEIHYHFKIAPSRLYRRQPEIIADAPRRLDPQQPLPILLLIKDAHLFPIELLAVEVVIAHQPALHFKLFNTEEHLATQWWWRVFHVNLPNDIRGSVKVNVRITYRCRGKLFRCDNDNYRTTSHAPLEVFVADEPLPTLPNFYHGDLHCHTSATSDQVEFGAPLPAMLELARAQGLSFFAATDHSYDLDDFEDDYLHNDPALRKWHALQMEIAQLNAQHRNFVIIPGEEVSCGNANGENVHFLVLNHPHFIRGRGDGGEKWLHTKPDHSIGEVLGMLSSEALAFAAHPAVPVPQLESLLLRRGSWSFADFVHPRLNGVQFWNGKPLGEAEGLAQWRKLLLEGRKLFAIAGNDAHGNFNRYRQIAWPCWSMAENHEHLFGHRRTVVKLHGALTLDHVLAALRAGRACITTGPLLDLQVQCANGDLIPMGESAMAATHAVITARSTAEYGKLTKVILWRGDLNHQREEKLLECTQFSRAYDYQEKLLLSPCESPCYVRAEIISSKSKDTSLAQTFSGLSNPIWIFPK